mmetsp:Transcript_10891/g.29193  ORF Transcript_10891/g.29193 Transcript_10891/m.29193 type:complete len:349 (+) Transcript_10891:477-1523(+)
MHHRLLVTHGVYHTHRTPNAHEPCFCQVEPFDLVVLDEAQDCSAVRLRVFMNICGSCPRVLAYDRYQSIYEFARGSVATIDSIAATHHFGLSTTFRFGPRAAAVASKFVAHYHRQPTFSVIAREERTTDVCVQETCDIAQEVVTKRKTLVVLARTHVALLRCALQVLDLKGVSFGMVRFGAGAPFHFVHPQDGTHVMRGLLQFKEQGVADHPAFAAFIKAGFTYSDFVACVDQHGGQMPGDDINWDSAIKFVKQMGNEAARVVNCLASCGGSASFGGASFVFSTIHASKGLDYEWVHLVDDGLLPPWHNSVEQAARATMARDGQVFTHGSNSEDLRRLLLAGLMSSHR